MNKYNKQIHENTTRNMKYKYWYVCTMHKNKYNPNTIDGFDCVRYNGSYEMEKEYSTTTQNNTHQTLISVCSYVPDLFHYFVLKNKLRYMYYKENIRIIENNS